MLSCSIPIARFISSINALHDYDTAVVLCHFDGMHSDSGDDLRCAVALCDLITTL